MSKVIDLSGGDKHLQEIAEESGIEWEIGVSHDKVEVIDGYSVETYYNESASSPWNAWHAFAKGYGDYGAPSKEEAIEKLFEKINNK